MRARIIAPQFSPHFLPSLMALVVLVLSASCNPTQLQSAGVRNDPSVVNESLLGRAYVYEDDPTNATGNKRLSANFNIGKILGGSPKQITPLAKTTLTNDCLFRQDFYDLGMSAPYTFLDCLKVFADDSPSAVPLQPNSGNWIFRTGSSEFYQVQAMYHVNKVVERLMSSTTLMHKRLHKDGNKSIPPAVPYHLAEMGTWWFKYLATKSQMTKAAQLTVYSTLTDESLRNNAFYEPVSNAVKLGWTAYPGYREGSSKSVLIVQDPSIIYHEMGHVFMTLFLNMRNAERVSGVWEPLPYQAFPYYGFYSELGAIGEGVADYFGYAMNGRPSFADWAFGRFVLGRRPLTEEHDMHAPGISSLPDERLSYPDYLLYEPFQPGLPLEDVHNGGMFASHYLVALTESLKTECFMDHNQAVDHVMMVMGDAFAHLGDLTGRGTDYNNTNDGSGKPRAMVNLHRNAAYDWYYGVRPITARRWAQAMARNIHHYITRDHCPNFTKEKSERLLDMYGLLLFRHYDDNGTFSNSTSASATRQDAYATLIGGSPFNVFPSFETMFANFPNNITGTRAGVTSVDEVNRVKSVLLPKAALDYKTGGPFSTIFIDDSQAFGQAIAASVLYQGRVITPSVGLAGWEYNNSNNRISPGEIIGIGLDMVNRSNIPIGGVTILATPWAHMKVTNTDRNNPQTRPCSINGFPSLSEGAVSCTDAEVLPEDGQRFKKPVSGNYPSKALHPVCMVQMSSNNETRWVSQDEYRRSVLMLQEKDCLGFGTPDFTPAECLARFVPGMEMAFMAQIAPQKSYIQTLTGPYIDYNASVPSNQQFPVPGPASSSVLLLEMNKWIPPGTTFACRLRAQFSNCSDCFEPAPGEDEYSDIEYAGEKPFKVLDLSFLVLE